VRSWEQNLTVGFGFNASNFVKRMGWSFCYNWCFAEWFCQHLDLVWIWFFPRELISFPGWFTGLQCLLCKWFLVQQWLIWLFMQGDHFLSRLILGFYNNTNLSIELFNNFQLLEKHKPIKRQQGRMKTMLGWF